VYFSSLFLSIPIMFLKHLRFFAFGILIKSFRHPILGQFMQFLLFSQQPIVNYYSWNEYMKVQAYHLCLSAYIANLLLWSLHWPSLFVMEYDLAFYTAKLHSKEFQILVGLGFLYNLYVHTSFLNAYLLLEK